MYEAISAQSVSVKTLPCSTLWAAAGCAIEEQYPRSYRPPVWVLSASGFSWMLQGLEVIEAHYLFGPSYDAIDIVIHPQSIIHSMVETADSSVLGQVRLLQLCSCTSCFADRALPGCLADVLTYLRLQLGWPNMKLPILVTMAWPERVPCSEATWPRLDFIKVCLRT